MRELRFRTVIFYFAALTLLTYSTVLLGFRSFYATDITTQNLGYRHWAAETIRSGDLPAWCPLLFTGFPVIAESQAGIFYPLFFLFLIFPVDIAYNLFVLSHYFLAGVFVFLFLRTRNVSSAAALIAATGFYYSSWLLNYHVYCNHLSALIWLPLIAACSVHFRFSRFKGALCATALFCLQILAGHFQFVWLTILFGLLLDLFTLDMNPLAKAKHLVAFWILAPLCGSILASIQVFPTIEFFANSQRFNMDYAYATTPSYELRFLAQAFLPNSFGNLGTLTYFVAGPQTSEEILNAFIGVLNLFFAIVAMTSKSTPQRWRILAIATIGIFLSLGSNNPAYLYLQRLPGFSFFRYPNRYLLLTIFPMLLLAGYGLDAFLQHSVGRRNLILAFGMFLAGLLVSYFISRPVLTQNVLATKLDLLYRTRNHDLMIGVISIMVIATASLFVRSPIFLLVLALAGGVFAGYRLPPTAPRSEVVRVPEVVSFLQKQNGARIDSSYDYYIEDNIYSPFSSLLEKYKRMRDLLCGDLNLLWNIPSVRGISHPLLPMYYYSHMGTGRSGTYPPVYSHLIGLKFYITDHDLEGTLLQFPMKERTQIGPLHIYEFTNGGQRAWVVKNWRLAKSADDIDFDPDQTAILDPSTGHIPDIPPHSGGPAEATITKSSNNELLIRCISNQLVLLVIADLYYPGWKATIDSRAVTIFRTDHLFRGVFVPPGNHIVKFQYPAKSIRYGCIVSSLSFLIFAVLYFRSRSRKSEEQ